MTNGANKQESLYEQIYRSIKTDILSGRYRHGEKLPSKRNLAEQFRVSLVTAENAYAQLIDEGYVRARQRSGYFVEYSGGEQVIQEKEIPSVPERYDDFDEEAEQSDPDVFPFSVWTRLMRSVIPEKGTRLLQPVDSGGAMDLRAAISGYIFRSRGICQPAERIIIGAGTEYLYNMLIQLLGRERCFAIENPGFDKLPKIYALNGVRTQLISLDQSGLCMEELYRSGAEVVHISPAHHFPTGIVMPISRRAEIMEWAGKGDRYIVEDDYDSEFRRSPKPVPTMFGMDNSGRVIYINTFSRTIAPSVRISYMCLPEELYIRWRDRLGFYACPVPAFEQYTLAKFISEGYFERHINRSRKRYKSIREIVLEMISRYSGIAVSEESSGLHFIVRIEVNPEELMSKFAGCGIKATPLSRYYHGGEQCDERLFVIDYSGANRKKLEQLL